MRKDSKLSQLIKVAFTCGFDSLIKEIFILREEDAITESLEINLHYRDSLPDTELLEKCVRFLVNYWHTVGEQEHTFIINNYDKDNLDYIKWFVLFFGYLQASEIADNNQGIELTSEILDIFNSEFLPVKFDTINMKVIFTDLKVIAN